MNIKQNQYLCGVHPFETNSKDLLTPACRWHDFAYTEGSVQQKILNRKQVDQIFLKQMLELAGDSKYQRVKAYTYYALVRVFGGSFWEGG